jgi:anthranilate phosphoribosyltransferase
MSAAAGSSRPGHSWPAVLGALLGGRDLSAADTSWAMDQIMAGDATPAQIAGFVVALRAKGETVEEVTGLVRTMLAHAAPLSVTGRTVDIVGTGGDRANTVNISTMASIVVAGAGERVVKHGNRAASSACGAADVLQELGVLLDLTPAQVGAVAEAAGITFAFAPTFHASMRHAAVPRRELGVPTVFNFLGPLTNPAQPAHSAIGCADPRMAGVVAGVFAGRGASVLVFRGEDGLDELTLATTSRVWVVHDGAVDERTLDPAELGLARAPVAALRGGDASFNAEAVRRTLAGERGPIRDAVLLNAAAALVALAGPDPDRLEEQFATGLGRAAAAVDSGGAEKVLASWVRTTHEVAGR